MARWQCIGYLSSFWKEKRNIMILSVSSQCVHREIPTRVSDSVALPLSRADGIGGQEGSGGQCSLIFGFGHDISKTFIKWPSISIGPPNILIFRRNWWSHTLHCCFQNWFWIWNPSNRNRNQLRKTVLLVTSIHKNTVVGWSRAKKKLKLFYWPWFWKLTKNYTVEWTT